MKYFHLVFMLFLITNSIECFKPSMFCKKTKNSICLNYDCELNICSIDKPSCDYLISWKRALKIFTKHEIKQRTFMKFNENIKICQTKEFKNQWAHRFNFG